jgi:hypothetical protein
MAAYCNEGNCSWCAGKDLRKIYLQHEVGFEVRLRFGFGSIVGINFLS